MAVTKFYANWEKQNGNSEIINAFRGLRLKENAQIITKPKEKGRLYDVETGIQVLPNQGRNNGAGQPYFSYYPGEESPLKGRESSFEYTPELNVFLRAFDGIKTFKMQEWNKETVVEFKVKKSYKLHRIDADDDFFIVKLYIELSETKPYSYFYKYNGRMALEFLATSEPTPLKRVLLAERGVPLFEAKAVIPEWIRENLPEEFATEEQFEQVAKQILRTYSKTNYRLLGRFKKAAVTMPIFKERYEKMDKFETQCRELEEEIERLTNKVEKLKNLQEKLEKVIKEQRKQIKEQKELLDSYRRKNEYYERIKADNVILTEKNKKLLEENETLSKDKETLLKDKETLSKDKETLLSDREALDGEVQTIKEELEESLSRQTWLSKLLMKKKK